MSDQATQRRFWRILTITLFFVGCLLFAGSSFLWDHYAYSRPRVAQPDLGLIYSLNYHGTAVYLTQAEYFWLRSLEWAGVTSILGSLLIWVFVLKQKRLEDVNGSRLR
jgi:hypothetical protein